MQRMGNRMAFRAVLVKYTKMKADLSGKTAIVTGAAQGIGKAVAEGLADSGAQILAVDILAAKEAPAGGWSGRWRSSQTDVSDPQAVEEMVRECDKLFGSPDILVNVAGITHPCPMRKMSLEIWQRMLDVNLTSVFLTSKAVLPGMLEKRSGSIINFSSIYAETGGMGNAHYSAAKAGIEAFSKALAREVGPSGIRVNVIAPGLIETRMLELMTAEQKAGLIETTPLKRIGYPADFLGPVLLLASEAGSYMTGQVIRVNGGMTMT